MQSLAVMQGIDMALAEDRAAAVRTLIGDGQSDDGPSAPAGGFAETPFWEQ